MEMVRLVWRTELFQIRFRLLVKSLRNVTNLSSSPVLVQNSKCCQGRLTEHFGFATLIRAWGLPRARANSFLTKVQFVFANPTVIRQVSTVLGERGTGAAMPC